MFYSQFILAKKGPLGTIWIAAHLERKLRKNQVADTDIGVSVDSILFPEVPIALRLSSHLLLGVVRIYSRKVNYLFDDCSDALLKVRQAFRSAAVDLPPEESKAPYHSITLPETFDLDDFELPDAEIFQGDFVDHHVSSKEQITLQDTMEGVVYPTSQFGPDERFGDADTSQIGLDLDEELLLNKGESSGHGVLLTSSVDPQPSVDPSSTMNGEETHEKIDDASEATANYTIQGPATPGLLEEPYLPSPQEAQVSEDHVEEDHNLADPVAKEFSDIAPTNAAAAPNLSSVHLNNFTIAPKDLEIECIQVDKVSESKLPNAISVQCEGVRREAQTIDLNGSLEPSGHSHKVALELHDNTEANDLISTTLLESKSEVNQLNDPIGISTSVDQNGTGISTSIDLNGSLEPSDYSHRAAQLPDKTHANDGFPSTVLVSRSEMGNSLDPTGISTSVGDDGQLEQSHLEQRNIVQNTHALMPQGVVIMNHDGPKHIESADKPLLQACTRDSDLLYDKETTEVSIGGKQEVIQSTMDAHQDPTVAPCEVADGNLNKLDTEANRVSEDAQVENEHGVDISDIPSPEKMMSLLDVPGGQDITPAKEFVTEGYQDTTMNKVSGKKRSFTESTVTLQSLNSAESLEAAQSKRSTGAVPDDDDLLSSILVGRRSAALTLKPTPPASEFISSKRPRVGSRSSAQKRKALVDDSMVLHGDIIREQLISTVDIRRVRKKAPSTRPEIWMLQKQALEDRIFTEPLFAGMSTELVWLNCQPFDLSRMKIVEDDRSKSDLTATVRAESSSGTTVCELPEQGRANMPSLASDDGYKKSLEPIPEFPIQSTSMVTEELDSDKTEKETVTSISCNETSLVGGQEEKIEIELDRMALDDVEMNQSFATEVQFGSSLDYGPEHNADSINNYIVQSSKESAGADESFAGSSMMLKEQCIRKDPCEDISASVRSNEQEDDTNIGDRNLVEHRSSEGNIPVRADIDTVEAPTSSLTDFTLPVYSENFTGALSPRFGGLEPNFEQDPTHMRSDDPGMVNNDEVNCSGASYDNNGPALDYLLEGSKLDSAPLEGNLSGGNFMSVEGEHLEADPQIPLDAAITTGCEPGALDLPCVFEDDGAQHDTGFLNYDDDDDDEIADDDNSLADPEGAEDLDNSGWSTRTRAVANYLQNLFNKEALRGRRDVCLDNLLAGKTRKEASRMFFETLVLKTRDYIEAEQQGAFGNINVKPRLKLMKSAF